MKRPKSLAIQLDFRTKATSRISCEIYAAEIEKAVETGETFEGIAQKAGCSETTVWNHAKRKLKHSPRTHTMLNILKACGFSEIRISLIEMEVRSSKRRKRAA